MSLQLILVEEEGAVVAMVVVVVKAEAMAEDMVGHKARVYMIPRRSIMPHRH